MWGHAATEPIITKFCVRGLVADVITGDKFCRDRLRCFQCVGVRKWGSPIDLGYRPYNRSALPCCLRWGHAPTEPIITKFGVRGLVANVITGGKSCRDRLWGFRSVEVRKWGLPLTWTVALTTGQQYRAACERTSMHVSHVVRTARGLSNLCRDAEMNTDTDDHRSYLPIIGLRHTIYVTSHACHLADRWLTTWRNVSVFTKCVYSLSAYDLRTIFTARRYASAVLTVIVCLCVTSRSCTKMAKPRIRLTTPYDSPETLVFRCQKSWQNSNDITPNGGAK